MIEKGNVLIPNELSLYEHKHHLVLDFVYMDGEIYVYTCPISKNTRVFNKQKEMFYLIPEPLLHYKKLVFAKIESRRFRLLKETTVTDIRISKLTVDKINQKIKQIENNQIKH